jgi:hypothetical protein
MPGRGAPPAAGGRGGRWSPPAVCEGPRSSAGRSASAGRGAGAGRRPMPWLGANGLLPGRGAPGRAPGRAPGTAEPAGFGAAGASGASGAAAAAGASAAGAAGASVAGAGVGAATGAAGASTGAAGAAGASGAAAFGPGRGPGRLPAGALGADGASAGAEPSVDGEAAPADLSSSPNCFLKRIATGGSTVDDADFTNSPISFSFSRTNLLSTPNSLASSWTRGLATGCLTPSGPAPCQG